MRKPAAKTPDPIVMQNTPKSAVLHKDVLDFITVTCKIWRENIGLGHETSMAETETLDFQN